MPKTLRCRLGKHMWRSRTRDDGPPYFCELSGKTRDKPLPQKNRVAAHAAWVGALAPASTCCRGFARRSGGVNARGYLGTR